MQRGKGMLSPLCEYLKPIPFTVRMAVVTALRAW